MKEILKEIYDFSLWLGLDLDVQEEHVEREREREREREWPSHQGCVVVLITK